MTFLFYLIFQKMRFMQKCQECWGFWWHFFGTFPAHLLSSPVLRPLACSCVESHWQLCNDLVSLSAHHGARSNLSLGLSCFWLASAIMPGIGPAADTDNRSIISGPSVWWGHHGAGALTGKWFILIRWLEGFLWSSRREGTEVSHLYSSKSHHHLIKIQLP